MNLRDHQMASKDDPSAALHQVLDGRDGGADPSVVGDLQVLVQGNVEIHPHENPLPLDIGFLQVTNTPLRRHSSTKLTSDPHTKRNRTRSSRSSWIRPDTKLRTVTDEVGDQNEGFETDERRRLERSDEKEWLL